MKSRKIKKLLLCYNPFSGNGRSTKIKQAVMPVFEQAGIEVMLKPSEYAKHFLAMFAELPSLEDVDCVALIGGDGSLNEVINGLMARPEVASAWAGKIGIPIGLIPGGTGNAFAHDLGFGSDYLAAAKAIAAETPNVLACDAGFVEYTMNVDGTNTIYVPGRKSSGKYKTAEPKETRKESRYIHNLVGLGLGVDANIQAEKLRFLGPMRYDLSILLEILKLKKKKGAWQKLEIVGQEYPVPPARGLPVHQDAAGPDPEDATFSFHFPNGSGLILIQNTVYGGTKLSLAPDARINDGYLDIIYADKLSARTMIGIFNKIKAGGKHVLEEGIQMKRFRRVKVEAEQEMFINLDGENHGKTPCEITAKKGLFSVIAGRPKSGGTANGLHPEMYEGVGFDKLRAMGLRS